MTIDGAVGPTGLPKIQLIPIRIRLMPITAMMVPVTTGGKKRSIRETRGAIRIEITPAAMIAPNRLIVETSTGPQTPEPPKNPDGPLRVTPGTLKSPMADAVRAELDRARRLLPKEKLWTEAFELVARVDATPALEILLEQLGPRALAHLG